MSSGNTIVDSNKPLPLRLSVNEASLTLSLRGNGLLLSTIVLPLDIPILIFGTSAIYNASIGMNYNSEMLFLTTLLVLFLIIAPFAASFGVRNSLD